MGVNKPEKAAGAKILKLDLARSRKIKKRRRPRQLFRMGQLGPVFNLHTSKGQRTCLLGLTEDGLLSLGIQTTAMQSVYDCYINEQGFIYALENGEGFQRLLRGLRGKTNRALRVPTSGEAANILIAQSTLIRENGLGGIVGSNNKGGFRLYHLLDEDGNMIEPCTAGIALLDDTNHV